MKRSLGSAIALFGGSLAVVFASGRHYCETRWIALFFAIASAVLFARDIRRRDLGEMGAVTLVVFAGVVLFDAAFFYIATRHCH